MIDRSHVSVAIDDDLNLKRLGEEDAGPLFALAERNRSDLQRWLPSWSDATGSVEECRALARHVAQRHAVSRSRVFGVHHRGILVGTVGLRMEAPWEAEVGYWLGKDHWGKGIITRSLRALLDYAFDVQRVSDVAIRCEEANVMACAVPERLGFKLEATVPSREEGTARRHYRLSFSDWAARH